MIESARVIEIARVLAPGGGVFIEAGANDGIRQSNSLALERELGWTGLLIEPSPKAFSELQTNRPACYLVRAALVSPARAGHVIEGAFRDGHLTGTVNTELLPLAMDLQTSKFQSFVVRFRNVLGIKPKTTLISVPTTTLRLALRDALISKVDLLSLDVEGHELEALMGLDFDQVKPKAILLEIRKDDAWDILRHLAGFGYVLVENMSNFDEAMSPTWTRDHEDFLFVTLDELLRNTDLQSVLQSKP